MAKKPTAARGKTTRKGKIKKIVKKFLGTGRPLSRATAMTLKGVGASGIGMAGQAMKLAKKLKPSGRLNADDIKRAKQMMSKRKGK